MGKMAGSIWEQLNFSITQLAMNHHHELYGALAGPPIGKESDACFIREVRKDPPIPLYYPARGKKHTLVLGINPSLQPVWYWHLKARIGSFSDLLKMEAVQREKMVKEAISIQESLIHGDCQIQFFKVITAVLENAGLQPKDWDHYDLYPIRFTSQLSISSVINGTKMGASYHEKCWGLLEEVMWSGYQTVISLNKPVSDMLVRRYDLTPSKRLKGERLGGKYGLYKLDKGPQLVLYKQLTGGGTSNSEKGAFIRFLNHLSKKDRTK